MSAKIAKALLSKGMFPRDLPPVFTTVDLGKKFTALQATIKKSKRTKPERYSLPKARFGRRMSYIVNPIPYFLLCGDIASNWALIRKHLTASKISAHVPSFFGKPRAIKDIDFKKIRERKIVDGSGHSYVLTTDYARFFPTIYTHSIPWALHTKPVAKANPKDLNLLGNLLDMRVMQLQEGQTAGIPVGPDASYILAEIVASSIDREYVKISEQKPFGLRYVDDFMLFFSNRGDAERALSFLSIAAGEYQIELNPEKTSILNITEESAEAWVFSLSHFLISRDEGSQRDSLAKLTEFCISLFAKCDDGSIGKYAIKKISSCVIATQHIDFAIACVLRLCAISPGAYSDAVAFISSYARAGYKLDFAPITRFVENSVAAGLGLAHDLEVCWSLWLAFELKIKISKQTKLSLEKSKSSIVIILSKLLSDYGLLRGGNFSPDVAASAPTSSSFESDKWLLHYEGSRRNWFGWSDVALKASSMSVLDTCGVNFLDLSAVTPSILEARRSGQMVAREVIATANLKRLQELFKSRPINSPYGMRVANDDEDEDDEDLDEEFWERVSRRNT
jgi:hypothetical protein